MDIFTISQLEQFSGIKAHTIRIWEKRYNALNPNRSEGNTRYYDSEQLKRLLNIVSLSALDFKVSELCALSDKQLSGMLREQLSINNSNAGMNEYFISQLTAAATTYDESYFEKIFSGCILRYGLKTTYTDIIYPLLARTGIMWQSGVMTAAGEHFMSNMIRQKLFTAIDSLPPASNQKGSWLLYLPENEFHEIGLLMASYLIRQSGRKVIYLGANVPFETLKEAVANTAPSNLLLFLVHYDTTENTQTYHDMIMKQFKHTQICVSGHPQLMKQLRTGRHTHIISSIEALEKQLHKSV